MSRSQSNTNTRLSRTFFFLGIIWLLAIAASTIYELNQVKKSYAKATFIIAESLLRNDTVFLRWAAMHVTNSRQLDQAHMNPASFMQQFCSLSRKLYGMSCNITSEFPQMPQFSPVINRAISALPQPGNNKPVLEGTVKRGSSTYFQFFTPLHAQGPCLKCHQPSMRTPQGVLGKLYTYIPVSLLADEQNRQKFRIVLVHLSFGLLGLLGLFVSYKKIHESTECLKTKEEQFRTLLNASPDIICFKDAQGRWLEVNKVGRKLFMLEDVDFKGKKDSELANYAHPNYQEILRACQASDEEAWEQGQSVRLEKVIPLPDGSYRVFDLIKIPLFEKDGRRKGLMVLGRDITHIKKTEEERQMLASAVENAADAIIITDPTGNIQYVNPAFERMTGYSAQEVIGKNPRILKSGKHDDAFYKKLWETIARGRVWEGRVINRRKDGSLYTADVTIFPVFDSTGNIIRYVSMQRDVTEHVKLHEEKARLESQLQQAQRLESIGRLAGGVAHDLNNLLTPILGFSELILQELHHQDRRKSQLEQIVKAANKARDIVRQLLAFSRKQTVEIRPVNLNDVLAELEKLLRRTLRENIVLQIKFTKPLPLIEGDTGLLQQVIMNLVANAQDAMDRGGTCIIETRVVDVGDEMEKTHPGLKKGRYVLLRVSDTGCGMDEETRQHIFEPFYTRNKEQGTGLGLATVYGIVKQLGGHIYVWSKPGKGTTFELYFPALDATERARAMKERQVLPRSIKASETILLVEDDQAVRNLTMTMLEKEGYRVLVAISGEDALALLNRYEGTVDLLLTDVVMPGMNGKELYNLARKKFPHLKVLYMSGYTKNVIANHGVLENGTAFILKPFTIYELTYKIREILKS
ncbi:MAG: PAS domain S-box protein [Thermodesulfobacteria bacterium]|nr:PAS domain S-box protein [Thermodesulfobacteriota bacterium]